jgi:excisionase family DNA binding protein
MPDTPHKTMDARNARNGFVPADCLTDLSAPPALPQDLLTVEQAAAHLQVSQSSIRSYIRQGRLKAFRVAGLRKVLIPRDELLSLLEPAWQGFGAAE